MNRRSPLWFLTLFIASSAFSEPLKKGSPPNSSFFEQGMALAENRYPKGYNAAARIEVKDGSGLNIDASFIYWHVSQELMDIAVKDNRMGQTPETVAYQPFNYQPGFKIGAGWKTNYDNWSFFAEYTWLHQTTNYSNTLGSEHYWNLSDWFDTLDLAQTSLGSGAATYFPEALTSSWRMHLDLVDVAASRPFYQSKAISMAPRAGLRALWITQNIDLAANPGTSSSATSTNRSHCWSLGPNIGVAAHWMMSDGFRFDGMGSAGLLYTSYTKLNTKQNLSSSATAGGTPVTLNASTHDYNALRPSVELGLGMGWGIYCSQGRYYFDLSARYDFLQFWSQNMMRYWTSVLYGTPEPIGDLQLHGLTATARLDF